MTALSPFELAYCAAVILVAYALRGSTGFGSVLGMPLLALVIPMKVLVPTWTLLGIASSVAILGRDRRYVARRVFLAFLPWCALGIAVGLWLFQALEARVLARGLGALVVGYAAYALWGALRASAGASRVPRALGPAAAALAGAVGTVFGTMASVFFAMYLDARSLAKERFRATMSAMLLALSAARGIGYFAVGEFPRESWLAFGAALPAMLAGIYLGERIHVRLGERAFRWLVCATLFLSGIPLLLR